jgi:hypothetical protein
MLPLSLETYKALSGQKYFWSMFYFGIYALLPLQFLLLMLGGLIVQALTVVSGSPSSMIGSQILFGIISLAVVCYHFIVRPYVELLQSACRIPSVDIFRSELGDIKGRVDSFLKFCKKPKKKQLPSAIEDAISDLSDMTSDARNSIYLLVKDAEHISPGSTNTMRDNLRSAVGTVKLQAFGTACRQIALTSPYSSLLIEFELTLKDIENCFLRPDNGFGPDQAQFCIHCGSELLVHAAFCNRCSAAAFSTAVIAK